MLLENTSPQNTGGTSFTYGVGAIKPYCQSFLIASLIKTTFAPIERYRLIRQTQDLFTLYEKDRLLSFPKFVTSMVKQQGVFSLWRSNFASIILFFPQITTQVLFYENIKQAFLSDSPDNYLFQILSASICQFSTLLFVYPIDTVRVRQATELGEKKQNIYRKFRKTFGLVRRRDGLIKGLYSGLSVAAVHSISMAMITLGINKLITNQIPQTLETDTNIIRENKLEISYFLAFSLLYPLDSIRHRLQIKSILFNQEASKTKNMFEKFRVQLSNPQISWLYGGFTAHVLRSAITVGLVSLISKNINSQESQN